MMPEEPGRVIEDGCVLSDDGVVLRVGGYRAVRGLIPRADEVDFGDALLLPGLVNAHAHLELSDARPGPKPVSFGAWLGGVIRARSGLGDRVEQAAGEAARRGADESLGFGVTTVGDISKFSAATRPVLAESPLRVVSFGEIQAMAGRRGLLDERLRTATDLRWDGWTDRNRLRVGVSPHAPYTVEPDGYRRCVAWASATHRPICTHLAESPEEADFLRDHDGPLRGIWDAMREWDDAVPRHDDGSPLTFAQRVGLLSTRAPVLLAHANYIDDAELDLLAESTASVAFCPRTHAYFGHADHGRHRLPDMLARGINVCVGTDSRASSPDLNLVDDLRRVRHDFPELSAGEVWSLATWRASVGLGQEDTVGSLSPGRFADFAVFPCETPRDPLANVLDGDARPIATVISGDPLREP